MKELQTASKTVLDENGAPRRFRYFLLMEQVETGGFFCENYGVGVGEEGGAAVRIPGITTSAARIEELMSLLVKHQVGPAALEDIVADWL